MNGLNNAKLALAQCIRCLGCNRLEQPEFLGDNKCKYFISGGKNK
jgi:hypothetical protein